MAELWQALIDNSGGVIAVFTVILAFTTIAYVIVTAKLLKQLRSALLADMVLRVMEIYRSGIKEIVGKGNEKERFIVMQGWTKAYREAFIEVDKKLGTDFEKLVLVGLEAASKVWIKGAKEVKEKAKKMEKKLKEKEERLEKLEKEIKGNKGSGTS